MNKQHKWHKEIKAWADGAEIECKFIYEKDWDIFDINRWHWTEDNNVEYRIKPQPKPDVYLYVIAFNKEMQGGRFSLHPKINNKEMIIGKIKLEQDDE